jgi:signal transduction histidine kinase
MRYTISLDSLDTVLSIGYCAQFILAILIAYILNLYFNTFKVNFLRDWSIAWFFYSLAMLSYPIIIIVFNWKTSSSPFGFVASLAALLFSYLHIFAMLSGLALMDGGKNALTKNLKIVGYLGLFIASLICVLLYAQNPADYKARLFIRIGLKDIITSFAYLFIAIKLVRKKTAGVGYNLMTTSVFAYGLAQAFYFAVVVATILDVNVNPIIPSYFNIVDLFLISCTGLGITIWLLENETSKMLKVNRELDSFIYRTSHDLRAPIASILGITNLAKMETKEEISLNYFNMVESRAEKMDSVIADILTLARTTKAELKIELIDFNKLLHEVISDVKFNKGAKAINLRYAPDPAYVFYSDYVQVTIIIANLISNAVKYHDVEQADPFISVAFIAKPTETVIEIGDNGTGIAKEHQKKIFDMFFRASTQSDGTGLGLYIVTEAITKLRGKITVESELGKGTLFRVTLPTN